MVTARGNNPDHPWVQPIVISKNSTHENAVRAVAQASVLVWEQRHDGTAYPLSNYEQWLSGPFTKTVRRASLNDVGRLLTWAEDNDVPHTAVATRDGAGTAVAFPPMRYADMPKLIAKTQVQGTDFPYAGEPGPDPGPWTAGPMVRVLVDKDLTTGKAAAAAAHALWAWMLPIAHSGDDADVELIDAWTGAGCPFVLDFADSALMHELDATGLPGRVIPIRDRGLTEVAPHTLTAIALNPLASS